MIRFLVACLMFIGIEARAEILRLAVTTMAEVVHREAQAQGEGSNNVSAIIRPLEKLAGVEVRPRD